MDRVWLCGQGRRHGVTIGGGGTRTIWSRFFPSTAHRHNVKRWKVCGGLIPPPPPPPGAAAHVWWHVKLSLLNSFDYPEYPDRKVGTRACATSSASCGFCLRQSFHSKGSDKIYKKSKKKISTHFSNNATISAVQHITFAVRHSARSSIQCSLIGRYSAFISVVVHFISIDFHFNCVNARRTVLHCDDIKLL